MVTNHLLFTLNKILQYNESSLQKLKHISGKSFLLNILGFSLSGIIDDEGFILAAQDEKIFDVEIFVPLESAKYLIEQDKLGFFQKIKINGNKNLARDLLEIFSNLHFTGIYTAKSPIINLLINKLINSTKSIITLFKLTATNTTNSITEYLLYQTEDLLTHNEVNKFYNEVDELKGQVDILQKRIDSLVKIFI